MEQTTISDVLFNPHVAPRRSNDCRWQNISLHSKCYSKNWERLSKVINHPHNWYVSPCNSENVATYNYLGWKCYIAAYFVMVVSTALLRHRYLWYCISDTLRYSVWVHLEILKNHKNRVGIVCFANDLSSPKPEHDVVSYRLSNISRNT